MRTPRLLAAAVAAVLTVLALSAGTAKAADMDHIVWVIGENSGYSQVKANSYFSSLAAANGDATNEFAIMHPSLPNYLALSGGSTFGVTDDAGPNTHPIAGQSIFGQTQGRTLAESMPSNCYKGDTTVTDAGYSAHHNPQIYYTDEAALCATNNIAYNALTQSNPNLAAPFTFVVPNKCDDAHNLCKGATTRAGAIANFATYVQAFIADAQATTQWTSSRMAIVVTFDEDANNEGNHVYTVVISNQPHAASNATAATHYTLLGTTEDLLGLPRLRSAVGAGSIANLFTTGTPPPCDAVTLLRESPNPAVTSAVINYTQNCQAKDKLDILNSSGTVVKNLMPGTNFQTVGNKQIMWDLTMTGGGRVPTGSYTARMTSTQADGTVQTDSVTFQVS